MNWIFIKNRTDDSTEEVRPTQVLVVFTVILCKQRDYRIQGHSLATEFDVRSNLVISKSNLKIMISYQTQRGLVFYRDLSTGLSLLSVSIGF